MQATTEPQAAPVDEAQKKLSVRSAHQQQSLLIAQWAATWTTFLQRDAYPKGEKFDPPDLEEPIAS